MLDTSGAPLHQARVPAGIHTGAHQGDSGSGIIDLAHVRRDTVVMDPFCGSGTFLIESAMHAMKIAPGMRRHFAAERWGIVPEERWD